MKSVEPKDEKDGKAYLDDGQSSIANGQKQKMQKKKRKANFVTGVKFADYLEY